MKKIPVYVPKAILWSLPFVILWAGYMFWQIEYDTFLYWLVSPENYQKVRSFIPVQVWVKLKVLMIFAMIGAGVFLHVCVIYQKKLIRYVLKIPLHYLFTQISSFSQREKVALSVIFILTVSIRCYYIYTMPVHVDEAATYNIFVSRGIFAAISFYSYTNNHVLHSAICCLFVKLPCATITALRIPALLYYIGTFWLLAAWLREKFSTSYAILGVSIFASFFLVLLYGILSRGYGLLLFWALLAWISSDKASRNPHRHYFLYIYMIACVLGTFTLTSFIYICATLSLYYGGISLVRKEYRFLRKMIAANLGIFIGILLVYLPIFLVNGWGVFTDNPTFQDTKIPRLTVLQEIIPHLADSIAEIIGLPYADIGCAILLGLSIFLQNRGERPTHKEDRLWLLTWLGVPFLFMIAQSMVLFARIWIYFVFLFVERIGIFLKPIKYNYAVAASLFVLLMMTSRFHQYYPTYLEYNIEAEKVFHLIPPQKKVYITPLSDLHPIVQFKEKTNSCHFTPDFTKYTQEELKKQRVDYWILWDEEMDTTALTLIYRGRHARVFKNEE